MSIRMPRVCLWLLVLIGSLALPCLVSSKPPDLPIDLEDMLPPQMTPERNGNDVLCPLPELPEPPATGAPLLEVLHPQFPPSPQQIWQPNEEGMVVVPATLDGREPQTQKSLLAHLRPKVRRELASCILFGADPLLVLSPVDQLIEEEWPISSFYLFEDFRMLFDVLIKRHSGLTGQQPCTPANATKPMVFSCPFLGAEFRLSIQQDNPNPYKDILVQVQETNSAAVACGACGNDWPNAPRPVRVSNAGLTGSIVASGFPYPLQAISGRLDCNTVEPRAPCVCPNATEPAPSAESECPYMRQQHQCQSAAVEPSMANDALTNLQNLIDAEKLYQVAEDLRQRGQVSEALDCYELVRRLCPGSRFDTMANEGMDRIFAGVYGVGEEAATVTGEQKKSVPALDQVMKEVRVAFQAQSGIEEDPRPMRKGEVKSVGQLPPGVAAEVASLMKACRLAMETCQHQKAAQLAREAYAIAPGLVQADPLVYKMHLLTCKPKVGSAECSESVCPNGCTREKCGANCPNGCAEPCGNSKCQCHEQATGCCTAKKKCQKCCGAGCTPCTDKPAQGCPACQKKGSAKGCCAKGCCDKGCCEKCSGGKSCCDKGCCDKGCCDEGCCDEGCPKCKKSPCEKGSCPADSGCGHCPVNNMPPPHCPPQSRRQTGFIEPSLPPLDPELIKGLEKELEQVEAQQAEDLIAVIEEEEAPPMPQQPVAEQQFYPGFWTIMNRLRPCRQQTVAEQHFYPGCYQEAADATPAGPADNWWADLRKLLGNLTCADLATSPEQVRASCQFKIGDKVIQFHYGPTGLAVDVQPAGMAEDVGEFIPVD